MGLSSWLRGRGEAPAPGDLLTLLLTGFEREDYAGVMHLINDNGDSIRAQFRSWTKPPGAIRDDPVALQRYANTLIAIARIFEKAGDPSLYELLTAKDRGNPIVQWQKDCERADQLTSNGQAAEAVAVLRATLESMSQGSGSAVDHWRPRALGRLGIALTKQGHRSEAIRVTREALELCRLAGDEEGVRVYTTNLNGIGTYEVAAGGADSSRLVVAFLDGRGQILTLEELPKALEHVRWEIRDEGEYQPDAVRLREEGRAAGERGDYPAAIALLTQAAELAPTWALPVFDRAFTYLLEQDFEAALADYRKVLELSPHASPEATQAADMLAREAAGELPPGLYAEFALLPHMPPEERQPFLEQLVRQHPSHAPAWEAYANLIASEPTESLAAIEEGLGARPDTHTLGMLLVRKALALDSLGRTEEALGILQRLTASPGELLSTHPVAYLALTVIRVRQGA